MQYIAGRFYKKNDVVLKNGIYYIAKKPTTASPEKSKDWEVKTKQETKAHVSPAASADYIRVERGEKGDKGERGERGAPGKNGADGRDGKNGLDGRDGKDGLHGKNGADGKNGIDGKNGVNGKDGKDGIDGKDGLSIYYKWDGTKLGIRREDEDEFEFVDLKGDAAAAQVAIGGGGRTRFKDIVEWFNPSDISVDYANKIISIVGGGGGGAVMESDYTPAHSILVQQSGTGSPTALSIGNNTLVGRLSGGGSDIDDLSATQVRTLLNVADGATAYTDEMAQDAVGGIFADSSEIDFTYDDATPSITASLKVGSIDETKLDASVNASLDLADTAAQNSFRTIAVSGQSDVVADSATDTLTLVAGSNITITTNAATDEITIAASGSGGSSAFNDITSGTNTTAAMVVGTGASMAASGSGTIAATSAPLNGISGLGTGVATSLGVNLGAANKVPTVNSGGTSLEYAYSLNQNLQTIDSPTFSAITLSGGQIVFPSTQNPSSNANTLDDYEEGTWTPAITFDTPGDLSVTYSSQIGDYTKIGNLVTVTFRIVTSAFTHTTASGNFRITGFPFASAHQTNLNAEGALAFRGITKAGYTNFTAQINAGGSIGYVQCSGSGVNNGVAAVADVPTGGTIFLFGTLTYRA